MTASTISRIMRRSILVFRRARGVSSPCAGAFHRTPSSHPRTLGGRSPVDRPRGTIARTGAGGGLARALLPSGPTGVSPPAGVLPDRSSGPPFRLLPGGCPGQLAGLDPGGRGRVVSDRPSLLQGFIPARSQCADARAFVRAKLRHTREKVRGRLPAGLGMSRLGATRCGASGQEGCGAPTARKDAAAPAGEGDGPWPGASRGRQGGRGLPATKRRLSRGCYSATAGSRGAAWPAHGLRRSCRQRRPRPSATRLRRVIPLKIDYSVSGG